MIKNFSRVQMLETSDVCNKFSKSVSYETLVGGTTTTSRECGEALEIEGVITRRTSVRRGYLPEQGTHANEESLFASVTCFMRLPRRIQRMLLRMTIPALALIFTLATTSESRADCYALQQGWNNDCYDSWNPGEANYCGDGCTYTYNNGKLTVTATKPDAVIQKGIFSPDYYEEKAGFPNITNIEIAGEFKTIGQRAFVSNGATISGKGGVLYTNNIEHNAFGNNNTLTGTIIVSDKQTVLIAGAPWYYANLNATVILPPTIKSISGWAIWGLFLGPNAKIYCGVENCEELFKNVDCEIGELHSTQCKNNLKTLLASGKLLAYPDGCTKMGATGCTKCKNENFKLNDGECDRLRWTPAEAAKVLTDDNNNSVTITFKK